MTRLTVSGDEVEAALDANDRIAELLTQLAKEVDDTVSAAVSDVLYDKNRNEAYGIVVHTTARVVKALFVDALQHHMTTRAGADTNVLPKQRIAPADGVERHAPVTPVPPKRQAVAPRVELGRSGIEVEAPEWTI